MIYLPLTRLITCSREVFFHNDEYVDYAYGSGKRYIAICRYNRKTVAQRNMLDKWTCALMDGIFIYEDAALEKPNIEYLGLCFQGYRFVKKDETSLSATLSQAI
jgi:hypothetical protein